MMKLKPTQSVIDLKEPIRSTDFVSLQSIKNDRKTIGTKSVDDSQHMPRVDQQGTLQKVMAEAAKQESQLTSSDWQWIREAHKQAVLIDELRRRAQRELGLAEIRLSDEEHARILADLQMNKRIAANLAAANELYRARNEQLFRADREWREWIDNIDQKTIQNKRELLEIFMRWLGYKLRYIRQAWNQKHLTEIKTLTEIALYRQAESQRLHLQHLSDLDKSKQESVRRKNDLALESFNNSRVEKLIDFKQWQDITQAKHGHDIMVLLLSSMGFKPGFLPLPSKQLELDEKIEKLARMRVEIDQNRKGELEEFRTKLSELQSTALSVEHREKLLKKANHRDFETELQKEEANKDRVAEYTEDRARSLLASMGYKLDFIPLPWKRLEIAAKKESIETRSAEAADVPLKPESGVSQPLQQPPQKPKLFMPAFPSIVPNAVDLKEQNDWLDRLALDKKRDQLENIEAVNLKMSQLQAASQLIQTSLVTSELNKSAPAKDIPVTDIRQKIKAAK
jgi:hypothetical protein